MKKIFSIILFLLFSLKSLYGGNGYGAPPSPSQLFNDSEWAASFIGSYGFLSDAEPKINEDEVELFQDLLALIKVNVKAAAARLKQEIKPESSAALYMLLGNLYMQAGEHDRATKYYEKSIEKHKDFRRAHKNLGLIKAQNGDYDGAIVHLGRAVELGEKDHRNYGLLGYCHMQRDNFLAAEQAYRLAILHAHDNKDWKLGLAMSLISMEKYKEANAIFATILAKNPDDATIWLAQSNALIGLEKPQQAAVNIEVVRAMGKAKKADLIQLGDIYMFDSHYDLALEAYLEAMKQEERGTSISAMIRVADLLVRSHKYEEAKNQIQNINTHYANKSKSDELKLLTFSAKIARAEGEAEVAAKILNDIIQQDGTRGEAIIELANYYASISEFEQAKMLYTRAEGLEDFEYDSLLRHAQMEAGRKNYANAKALLERAISIKKEPRVEKYLERIARAARSLG